ncbi:MAG: hypothetical protein J6S29_02015, partial [Methanosphaera sp.]|nr:hypothetical protein [Methanosphaera sp.]
MLNNKRILLVLFTIFVLVGLQATFAADTTDSQIHDTTDSNIISTDNTPTITQTPTTDNANKIQKQVTNDDISTNEQSTNELTKTSKNSKTEDDPTTDPEVEQLHSISIEDTTLHKGYEVEIQVKFKNNNDEEVYLDGELTLSLDDSVIVYTYDNENAILHVTYVDIEDTEYTAFVEFTSNDEILETTVIFTCLYAEPSSINYDGFSVDDDATTFTFSVGAYDYETGIWFIPSTGTLNISGYVYGDDIDDIPFSASQYVNGMSNEFTFEGLNLNDYIGYSYYISAVYADPEYRFAKEIISVEKEIKPKSSTFSQTMDCTVYKDQIGEYIDLDIRDEYG